MGGERGCWCWGEGERGKMVVMGVKVFGGEWGEEEGEEDEGGGEEEVEEG